MEYWDVYDKFRKPKGFKILRGGERRLQNGEYHLTAHVCLFTGDGRMLAQKRVGFKRLWGGLWDISASGSVISGENTSSGAERELFEELGIRVDLSEEQPRATLYHDECISDYFVLRWDGKLDDVRLDSSEVDEVAFYTREQIIAMIRGGEFIPYKESFINLMFDMNESESRNIFTIKMSK